MEGGGGERAVSGVRRLVSQEPTEGNCAWGGEEETGEGEGLQRSTILVRSFAQSFCMPARFHARGTRVLARRGMRFDDGGVATTLREDMILERVLLYRRRKRALRLIFFFF